MKAVIFDLDGTLIDSMRIWTQIDVDFLNRYGYVVPDWLESKVEGMSFTETAIFFKKSFDIPLDIEEIKAVWNEYAVEYYAHKIPLKEGALEFLEFLRQNKIKIGIATSNNRELVDIVLDSLKIRHYFDSIRTSCEVGKGKPNPDIYLKVAEDLEVSPNECLVFEDVPNGILGGHNAGMTAWAIKDIQKEIVIEKLKKEADKFIINYYDAIEIWKNNLI